MPSLGSFSHVEVSSILALAVCICSVVASLSGTGGGSLFIALLSLAYPSDVHRAVPLSKAAVFGVAFGASIVNSVLLRGSGKGSSPINFPLTTLIQPATLIGCTIGVLLNLLLSSFVIAMSLVFILGFTSYKTIQAARRMNIVEEDELAEPRIMTTPSLPSCSRHRVSEVELVEEASTAMVDRTSTNYLDFSVSPSSRNIVSLCPLTDIYTVSIKRTVYQSQNDNDSEHSSFFKIPLFTNGLKSSQDTSRIDGYEMEPFKETSDISQSLCGLDTQMKINEALRLSSTWFINLLSLILAGGPVAIVCGSVFQKSVLLLGQLSNFFFILFTARRLQKIYDEGSHPEVRKQLAWLYHISMSKICFLSFLAGVAAGLLGIGGGLIKGPILISVGLAPIDAVATSNYMILFTSSTNVLSYFLSGRLDLAHALILSASAMIGGLVGVFVLRTHFSSKRGQVMLTYTLASTIILGGLAVLAVNLKDRFFGSNVLEETIEGACLHIKHSPIETYLTKIISNAHLKAARIK